jgi:hypothetical protein
VKLVGLVTVPFGTAEFVTVITPVVAPDGTVAWSSVEDTNVTADAATAWNFTVDVLVNPIPLIVTTVPDGPLLGVKPVIDNVGVNCLLLAWLPWSLLTVIVAAPGSPFGTTALIDVPEVIVTVGEFSDPNWTTTPAANPVPVIVTVLPVIPEVGVNDVIVGAPYA